MYNVFRKKSFWFFIIVKVIIGEGGEYVIIVFGGYGCIVYIINFIRI